MVVDLRRHVIPDFYSEASDEGGDAAGGITPNTSRTSTGVSLFSNADSSYLGASRFEPIFAELQERGAVVMACASGASSKPSATGSSSS